MAQRSSPPHQMATDNDREVDAVKEQRNSNLARIRDNQRRSRARRKEYLEELEGRLRSCQQLGIEATAEIQAAARRVVDENKRLRQLLKRRGFSDAEIDGLIIADELPEPALSSTSAGTLEGMLGTRKPCNCDDDDHLPPAASLSSSTTSSSGLRLSEMIPNQQPTSYQPITSLPTSYLAPSQNPPSLHLNSSIPIDFTHFPSSSSSSHNPHPNFTPFPDLGYDEPTGWLMNFDPISASSSGNTAPGTPHLNNYGGGGGGSSINNSISSCVAAADLIRTIRPDIKLEDLERELGCADGGECKVPLTQILSIMAKVGTWANHGGNGGGRAGEGVGS